MSMTALDLSPEALRKYRPLAAIRRRRSAAAEIRLVNRRRRAIQTARKAAELLRSKFGARDVMIFGSLARRGGFTPWSDIDLAAKDIPPARFYEAVGVVTGISAEFKIDLVDVESCAPSLRKKIEIEGKAI